MTSQTPSRWQLSAVRPHAIAKLAALTLVATLLGLLIWKVVHKTSGASLVAAIKSGDRPIAPAFDLPVIWNRPATWPQRVRPALTDGRVSLAELRGTAVVLNIWASWCIPCKDEAPDLAAAARKHRRDVAFLGLDVQDFSPDARRFLDEQRVPYPSVRESGSSTYTAYGLTGVPETFYIDKTGRVVGHSIGAVSRSDLDREITRLLSR